MSYLYQTFIEIAIIQQKKKEGKKTKRKEEIYKRIKFNREIKKKNQEVEKEEDKHTYSTHEWYVWFITERSLTAEFSFLDSTCSRRRILKKSHGQNEIQRSRVLTDDRSKKLRNGTVLFFPRAWLWWVEIYSDETITVRCLRPAPMLCLVVLSPISDVQLRSSKSIIFCQIFLSFSYIFLLYSSLLYFFNYSMNNNSLLIALKYFDNLLKKIECMSRRKKCWEFYMWINFSIDQGLCSEKRKILTEITSSS